MSSIDEESISAEEEASSADWFDMDADELAANLRVQLQLKSNVVDEGDTVATPPHNHHVNDKKVVPYEDDENDEDYYGCPAASSTFNTESHSDVLADLAAQPDATIVALKLATLGSSFVAHINEPCSTTTNTRLTLRCVALLCERLAEHRMDQHLDDVLNEVRTSVQFWRSIIRVAVDDDHDVQHEQFVADIWTVADAVRRLLGQSLESTVLVQLRAVIGGDVAPLVLLADDKAEPPVDHPSIVPTVRDLDASHEAPPCEANRLVQFYASVEQYAAVQMALVRHYFMQDVRRDIDSIRKGNSHGLSAFRLHRNIRIQVNKRYGGLFVSVPLSQSTVVGPLLLFTASTAVECLTAALVVHTSEASALAGNTNIQLINVHHPDGCPLNTPLLLLESNSHFEPHFQVYDALSRMHRVPHLSPIQRAIVLGERPPNDVATNVEPDAMVATAQPINDEQRHAVRQSIVQAIHLVHGPPGTGKTLVGQQIVHQLLALPSSEAERIVVVCATNQGLDDFLAGVAATSTTGGIGLVVRLGLQSKDKRIDRFHIDQLPPSTADRQLDDALHRTRLALSAANQRLTHQLHGEGGSEFELVHLRRAKHLADVQTLRRRLGELVQLHNAFAIRRASTVRVIGMTSSYAARCQTLLAMLAAETVIVEDASAMAEPLVMAELTPRLHRLVMLGHCGQNRLSSTAMTTSPGASKLGFNVSLFERLVGHPDVVPCSRLTVQHRMHPRIADVVRATGLYDCGDAAVVNDQQLLLAPDEEHVFFFDHSFPHEKVYSSMRNADESLLVRAVCDHLLALGYSPADLAILTPYRAQALQLAQPPAPPGSNVTATAADHHRDQSLLNYRGVSVTVLDGRYFGERRIVLLSLVRSAEYTAVDPIHMHRICVAMSHARGALLMFGHLVRLAGVWLGVAQHLVERKAVATILRQEDGADNAPPAPTNRERKRAAKLESAAHRKGAVSARKATEQTAAKLIRTVELFGDRGKVCAEEALVVRLDALAKRNQRAAVQAERRRLKELEIERQLMGPAGPMTGDGQVSSMDNKRLRKKDRQLVAAGPMTGGGQQVLSKGKKSLRKIESLLVRDATVSAVGAARLRHIGEMLTTNAIERMVLRHCGAPKQCAITLPENTNGLKAAYT